MVCASVACGQGNSRCQCIFKDTFVLFITVVGMGALRNLCSSNIMEGT